MTDQGTDTIKVQVGEPMSFIGMPYRNLGEGLFTGREMTQRQLYHRAHLNVGDNSQMLES